MACTGRPRECYEYDSCRADKQVVERWYQCGVEKTNDVAVVHWGQQLLFLMPVMATFHSWSLFKFLQQDQLCNNFSQSQPLPAATATFSNTHNIDLPIQKWHTVEVVVSTHKVQSTCKEEFIRYCTQRFAVSCNLLSCTPCRSKSDGPHDMHTQTTTTMPLPLLLLWFLHAQLSLRERERRGCVTSVHGKRVLEVVDVSTSWANEGSKFQGRPWDA